MLPEPAGVVEPLELVHVLHRGRLDLVVESGVPKHLKKEKKRRVRHRFRCAGSLHVVGRSKASAVPTEAVHRGCVPAPRRERPIVRCTRCRLQNFRKFVAQSAKPTFSVSSSTESARVQPSTEGVPHAEATATYIRRRRLPYALARVACARGPHQPLRCQPKSLRAGLRSPVASGGARNDAQCHEHSRDVSLEPNDPPPHQVALLVAPQLVALLENTGGKNGGSERERWGGGRERECGMRGVMNGEGETWRDGTSDSARRGRQERGEGASQPAFLVE